MYKSILKKDLKRKKTMNIILLIFITLAVMFVSSSAGNLLAVTSALDTYFEKAGVPDYFVVTTGKASEGKSTDELLNDTKGVQSVKKHDTIYVPLEAIKYRGKTLELTNQSMLVPFSRSVLSYFDGDGNKIEKVNESEIYLKPAIMNDNNIKSGDKITLEIENVSRELTVKGKLMDAVFSGAMMGNATLVLNEADYAPFANAPNAESRTGMMYYIQAEDISAVTNAITDDTTISFNGDRDMLKMTYIMDMIIAGLLLVVSVFLIIIAFVILRFTISFTISEEFREIGIMKAMGIKNRRIRGLYIVKYLAIAIVGAVVGFFASIPFGNMLLKQVSENMLLTNENSILINIICSLAVVAIVMAFCYRCTHKVKKLTPIDAIRNGQTGERFKRKGFIHLSRGHKNPLWFMSINDIFSGLKRFSIVAVAFLIGILMVTIPLNVMTTLKSGELITWFSMKQSDVFIGDISLDNQFSCKDGHEKIEDKLSSIESKLADNDIKAKCCMEAAFRFTVEKGDYKVKSYAYQGVGTKTTDYPYLEGTAPINKNEVALTHVIADKIHAKIGDTIKLTTAEGTKDYIVTALFQSMNNMGEGIRLNENVELDYTQLAGFFSCQINYTDNPSEQEIKDRMELIKKLYPDDKVYYGGEFIDYMVGGISGYMSSVVYLILAIVIIVNILVAVLMEKSFFTKEKTEIALLKAMGFRNNAIIFKQTLRMAIVMISATLLAIALAYPVGELAVGGIFQMMGAKTMIFDVDILQNYIIYPLCVLICTIVSVFIVNQQVRRVESSEINSIE